MSPQQLKNIVEAALFAAARPLSLDQILKLFPEEERPERGAVRDVLATLEEEWSGRGLELKQVGSGYRFQVRQELAPWIGRLHEERPPRYSRALLETLALIVYRQPITRAGIEEIRGVAVSSSIMKTLLEREWIRVVGHRDVPGRPALYGTTKKFLDDFNLKSLSELPPLAEIQPADPAQRELALEGLAAPDDAKEVQPETPAGPAVQEPAKEERAPAGETPRAADQTDEEEVAAEA